jgi:hypothetical protein
MNVKFILLLSIVGIAVVSFFSLNEKIETVSKQIDDVVTASKELKHKIQFDLQQSTQEAKDQVQNKLDDTKTQTLTTISDQLSQVKKGDNQKVLGVRVPSVVYVTDLKVDKLPKDYTVKVDPIELVNVSVPPEGITIKIFATQLESDKYHIADEYITLSEEETYRDQRISSTPGNPLIIKYHGKTAEETIPSVLIKPILTLHLPIGIYKGTYSGRIYTTIE